MTDKEAVYSVSRMVDLLETGDELDQEFILSEVEQLLGHCADDFQELLLPVLCRICPQWLPDLQFKAAKVRTKTHKHTNTKHDQLERRKRYM